MMGARDRLPDEHFPARWWHALPVGRIQCDLCQRDCKLHDEQRGLCFVRKREGDALVLTTYGRSSGFAIDPIEKKPPNHFFPGSTVFSFGTAGCNLACKFCQNWDISRSREMDRLMDQASPERIAQAAAETGYAANVDLKAFTDAFYFQQTGAHLAPVLDTLQHIVHETDCWLEITTLLIPGHNDSSAELEAMSKWLVEHLGPEVPLHFTAFHPDYKMTDVESMPLATVRRARAIALAQGLRHVYTGNVHDTQGCTTYCPHCEQPLIERDWHRVLSYELDERGYCRHCGTALAGRFGAERPALGRRHVPMRVAMGR
jgi:pyruvate formate lyase activating enzyme